MPRPTPNRPGKRGPKPARGEAARHRYEVWLTDEERTVAAMRAGVAPEAMTSADVRALAVGGDR